MKKSDTKKVLKFMAGLFVYGLTTLVVLSAAGFWWASHEFSQTGAHTQEVEVSIPRGTNIAGIADLLHQAGVVKYPAVFILAGRLNGQASALKAGEYEIAPHASTKDMMEKIVKGETIARRITLREGLTSFEIVRLLKETKNLSGEIKGIPTEGTLLPHTYDYQKNERRDAVIARMEKSMEDTIMPACGILLEAIAGTPLRNHLDRPCSNAPAPLKTVRDVLTLSSIVVKETGTPAERKRVAGVFLNRLRKNMPLQSDPTVIYAINKGDNKNEGLGPLGRRLLSKDLEIDSPYNTYKNAALPPGPICNPGKESIEAVLHPEENEFLYFVADGTGGHAFASTLAEHNKNVAEWRKTRKEAGN